MNWLNDYKFEALIEALKEGLRLVLIAVIPTILVGINISTGDITINWMIVKAVALVESLVFILRMLDKGKHEYNKLMSPERKGDTMGMIPF